MAGKIRLEMVEEVVVVVAAAEAVVVVMVVAAVAEEGLDLSHVPISVSSSSSSWIASLLGLRLIGESPLLLECECGLCMPVDMDRSSGSVCSGRSTMGIPDRFNGMGMEAVRTGLGNWRCADLTVASLAFLAINAGRVVVVVVSGSSISTSISMSISSSRSSLANEGDVTCDLDM